jgi:hypothetical protein
MAAYRPRGIWSSTISPYDLEAWGQTHHGIATRFIGQSRQPGDERVMLPNKLAKVL